MLRSCLGASTSAHSAERKVRYKDRVFMIINFFASSFLLDPMPASIGCEKIMLIRWFFVRFQQWIPKVDWPYPLLPILVAAWRRVNRRWSLKKIKLNIGTIGTVLFIGFQLIHYMIIPNVSIMNEMIRIGLHVSLMGGKCVILLFGRWNRFWWVECYMSATYVC